MADQLPDLPVYLCEVTDPRGDRGGHDRSKEALYGSVQQALRTVQAEATAVAWYPNHFHDAPAIHELPDGKYFVEWRATAQVGSQLVKADAFEIRKGRLVR